MSSRVSTEILPDGTMGVRVRAPRMVFAMIFLSVWLTGWTLGGMAAIKAFATSIQRGQPEWFLAFWLCGWIVGESLAAYTVLWGAFGAEMFSFRDGELCWRRQILGWGRSKSWPLDSIRNLRFAGTLPESGSNQRRSTQWTGMVAFESDGKEYRIGFDLSDSEAAELVEALKPYLPF